jgi:hypothetical protein
VPHILTEEDLVKIKAAHNEGELREESVRAVDSKFTASEEAFRDSVETLHESRRFSEQELSFRMNTTR